LRGKGPCGWFVDGNFRLMPERVVRTHDGHLPGRW
jgi:hypothetical protein